MLSAQVAVRMLRSCQCQESNAATQSAAVPGRCLCLLFPARWGCRE